jgi:hypothetical protein
MAKLLVCLSVLLVLMSAQTMAQTIEAWIESSQKVPVEKIYIQTDREYYFTGETLWLKSYLTDSRSGRLIPGAENVFLQLTGESGKQVLKVNLMSINGQAPGSIVLPDSLNPGNYLLSAYTDYLLNFGNESFFQKNITILKPARSLRAVESRQRDGSRAPMISDVSFLPEGGKLLEGIANLVAFKAIDGNGYGIDAKGVVKDASGADVVTFNTDYKGMGIFFITPEKGKSYHAVINGLPSFRFSFDSLIVAEGIKIQVVNQTSQDLLVNVSGNTDRFKGETFYLVNMHHGRAVFYQPVLIEDQNQLVKFNSGMLKGGINQLVLLDSKLRPVSERLIFSDNYDVNELKLSPAQSNFSSRSEANIHISGDKKHNEISNLSVSVVHESAFHEQPASQNILSWMLISSELNGFIETPAEYFSDSILNARAKQGLLMLTNGWSSYFWNSVPNAATELKYSQKAGLEIHGIATNVVSGEAMKNGEITLILEKDGEMAVLTQKTDNEGYFGFSGLLFNDTANVYLQAKNKRGRQNTSITFLQEEITPADETYVKSLKGSVNFPGALDILNYQQTLEIEKHQRKMGILPVNLKKQEEPVAGDGHFRIYEMADQVLEIPEKDGSYGNIIDYMVGRVTGLDVNGDEVTLRGTSNVTGSSTPLFLVDGIPLNSNRLIDVPDEIGKNSEEGFRESFSNSVQKVKSIPMGDIDKVEILKNPQNLAFFGVEGANGVIAIYTRRGSSENTAVAKGVIEQRIAGYSSYRKFYSPKYLPTAEKEEAPDFRTTLFWEPELLLKDGQGNLTFYTSDQPGKYKVIAEGITASGRICYGTSWLIVE